MESGCQQRLLEYALCKNLPILHDIKNILKRNSFHTERRKSTKIQTKNKQTKQNKNPKTKQIKTNKQKNSTKTIKNKTMVVNVSWE